jgi:hypothetical protein
VPISRCLTNGSWLRRTAKVILVGAAVSLSPAAVYARSNCILNPGSSPECSVVFSRGEFAVAAQSAFGLSAPNHEFVFPDLSKESPDYGAIQAAAPFMDWHVLCPNCWLSVAFWQNEPISNAQLAIAVVRILVAANRVQLLSPADADRVLAASPDAPSVPPPARPYIATAVITDGFRARLFPLGKLELAATYSRFEGTNIVRHIAKCAPRGTRSPGRDLGGQEKHDCAEDR